MTSGLLKRDSERTVRVTGLNQFVSYHLVKKFFKNGAGKVANCFVGRIADVTYRDPDHTVTAMQTLYDNTELGVNDEGIRVVPYREINSGHTMAPGKPRMDREHTVHVNKMRKAVNEEKVRSVFEKCGHVAECFIGSIAFVTFEKSADAAKAIETLNDNTKLGVDGEGIRVGRYRQNDRDDDDDEDNDKQFCLSARKLNQWIENHQVEASVLRSAANGGDQNRETCRCYSTAPAGSEKQFVDGDRNARKFREKSPIKDLQTQSSKTPSSLKPEQKGHEASEAAKKFTEDCWKTYLEYITEKKLLSNSGTTFVFSRRALKAIGSTYGEANNPGDHGSKLIIEKVCQNYLVRATNTEEEERFKQKNQKFSQGSQFEKDHTEGKPKEKGEDWFSVVSRKCSVTPNGSQPFKCQVIVRGEIDAYIENNGNKELVEIKSTEKTIGDALGYKSLIWWLQCEFANVDWLFLGEVVRKNGRRELLSFETLRNEVKTNDQKKAQAAIFKFMIFVNERFTESGKYVLKRKKGKKTYQKSVAEDEKEDAFIPQDMRAKIEKLASEGKQPAKAAAGGVSDN